MSDIDRLSWRSANRPPYRPAELVCWQVGMRATRRRHHDINGMVYEIDRKPTKVLNQQISHLQTDHGRAERRHTNWTFVAVSIVPCSIAGGHSSSAMAWSSCDWVNRVNAGSPDRPKWPSVL